MRIFATEFEVEPQSSPQFVKLVLAWIKGINGSSLHAPGADKQLDSAAPMVTGPKGDKLQLHAVDDRATGVACQGFRYDAPDGDRIWRIEGVLTRETHRPQALLRIRAQSLALSGLAELHRPNKPFLIKTLIRKGKVRKDRELAVLEKAHRLAPDEAGLSLAERIISGQASRFLPVVYVSARSGRDCALSDARIEALARELGGVAHVVREPDRAFSFKLKEKTGGGNVYGGAVGISVPGRGFLRRLMPRWEDVGGEALKQAVLWAAIELRSQMASDGGWDWSQLQERRIQLERQKRPQDGFDQLKRQELEDARAKLETQAERDFAALLQQLDQERADLQAEAAENEALWQEEIESKEDRIRDLENLLTSLRDTTPRPPVDGMLSQDLIDSLGPQLWSGEFSDRVLLAIAKTLEAAEGDGLDARSIAVLRSMRDQVEFSGGAAATSDALARAVTDPKKMAGNLVRLLVGYGFEEKADKKHIRLSPKSGYVGLAAVTLPKTPSDHRTPKNQKRDIEKNLGLGPLKKLG